MILKVKPIYDELRAAIDLSCSDKSRLAVEKVLEKHGFHKDIKSSGFKEQIEYDLSGLDGWIRLGFESYDKSKTFSVKPDINKYELELWTRAERHTNCYED